MAALRVFYGWTRLGKVRKHEAVSVIFENARQDETRTQRFVSRMQETVYTRLQTDMEAADGADINRMFTEYNIRLDSREVGGSLKKALEDNMQADRFNVTPEELIRIRDSLYSAYMSSHPMYREPVATPDGP